MPKVNEKFLTPKEQKAWDMTEKLWALLNELPRLHPHEVDHAGASISSIRRVIQKAIGR